MMNQFVIVGKLNKKPTIDEETNKSILSVEVQRPYKNKEGIYEKDIIKCTASGTVAQRTVEHCNIGDVIGIKGMITSNNILLVEKITYLSKAKEEE